MRAIKNSDFARLILGIATLAASLALFALALCRRRRWHKTKPVAALM